MLMYTHISTPKCQIGTFYFIVFILFLDVGVLGHILRPIRKNTPVKLCQHFTDKSHCLQLQSALNPTNKSSPQFLLKTLCTPTDSIHIKTTLLETSEETMANLLISFSPTCASLCRSVLNYILFFRGYNLLLLKVMAFSQPAETQGVKKPT